MGNYSIDLCPKVNRGALIHKTVVGLPEVRGYEVPLKPTACELIPEEGWYIPLMPPGGCPFPTDEIRWAQEEISRLTPFGTTSSPTDYWRFSIVPPQGLFEGSCVDCFPRSTAIHLVGSLGFNGGIKISSGRRVTWRVHRSNLPFPGELLVAVASCPDGNGDARKMSGDCTPPQCDTPPGDCIWGRSVSLATSGTFLSIGSVFFATPTWTGGVLVDYFTQSGGWAEVPAGNHVFPSCDVYGDPTLQYKIDVEGTIRIVTSVGFAGYGIGTHVLLKKLDRKYCEPFTDACLGVDVGSPSKLIEYEQIGVSIINSLTPFSPPLSPLSTLPIDKNSPITVITSYDTLTNSGWRTTLMTVNVNSDGFCSGDCLMYDPDNPQGEGGMLDIHTGEWLLDIIWTNIPNADRPNVANPTNVIQILCEYTKAEEPCIDVVIVPWHIMGMGG